MSAFSIAKRRNADAAVVCRKDPAIPDSIAEMAFASAARLVSLSSLNFAKAAASFSLMAVAAAIAAFASARLV